MTGACFCRDAACTGGLTGEYPSQPACAFRIARTMLYRQAPARGVFILLSTLNSPHRNALTGISRASGKKRLASLPCRRTKPLRSVPHPMRSQRASARLESRPAPREAPKWNCSRTGTRKNPKSHLHRYFQILLHGVAHAGQRPVGKFYSSAVNKRSPLHERAALKRMRRELAPPA